jgi:hypothetical protein
VEAFVTALFVIVVLLAIAWVSGDMRDDSSERLKRRGRPRS